MSEPLPKLDLYEEEGAGDDGVSDDGAGDDSIVPGLVSFALAATAIGAIGYGIKMYLDDRAEERIKEAVKASMRPRTAEQAAADRRDYVREWQEWLRTPEGNKFAQKEPRIAAFYRAHDAQGIYRGPRPAEPAGALRPKPPFVDPTPTQLEPMRRPVIPQHVPPYEEALVRAGVGKRTITVGASPAERVAYDDWNRKQEQRNSPGELARWFEEQRAKKGR